VNLAFKRTARNIERILGFPSKLLTMNEETFDPAHATVLREQIPLSSPPLLGKTALVTGA
jgi:predicted subunit of tRNA(5-methylaminomethyl-2-thiouridylate) methyltransferase